MDNIDKKIITNQLAKSIGSMVSKWVDSYAIDEDVMIGVSVESPTCYFDEHGVAHDGRIITVNIEFGNEDGNED